MAKHPSGEFASTIPTTKTSHAQVQAIAMFAEIRRRSRLSLQLLPTAGATFAHATISNSIDRPLFRSGGNFVPDRVRHLLAN